MAYQDINTSGWKEGISYEKYDPVYFNKSLVGDFTVLNFTNNWTAETGTWDGTDLSDDDFYGQSIKTSTLSYVNPLTGDHILSSPKFKINPLSNYEASVYIAKQDDSVTTENPYRRDVFQNGAGLTVSFYDAAGDKIYAGVNFIETHKLIELNKISTSGWQNLVLKLPYREIPQYGTVAVSGSLDLVVYGQKKGPVYFSGAKIYNDNQYYYASGNHTSSLENSPTGASSKWTQKFQYTPSYNSSATFDFKNDISQYGDGYFRVIQKGTNALKMETDLKFETRTDQETESILHFLKNQKGFKPFFFTMPDPYDKEMPYFCEEYDYVKNYENNNTVQAKFVNDVETILTKKNIFLSESPAKNRYLDWDPGNYEVNDVAFFEFSNTGDDNYYYKKSNLTNLSIYTGLSDNPDWTKDLFFWKPSIGLNISKRPRIVKSNIKDEFTVRGEDGLNEDLLQIEASFNNRSDKEAAAILHFLEQRRGFKSFKFLPPYPYGQYIDYSGAGNTITGDRSLYNMLSVGDDVLFIDSNTGYASIERKIKDIDLVSGDSDYNLDNGLTKITLFNDLHSHYEIESVQANKKFALLKNFICSQWSHDYVFSDNNNIRTKMIETPFRYKQPPSLYIDGDINVGYGSSVDYQIKAKDQESIKSYRFYNLNDPESFTSTGTSYFSKTETITFNTSGLNILRLEAVNNLDTYNYIDYEVMVLGTGISTSISNPLRNNKVEKSGSAVLVMSANSRNFISGTRFWWNDSDGIPEYTPVNFNNKKISKYNPRLTGTTAFSENTERTFNTPPGTGAFTLNYQAKDFAGNESQSSLQIDVIDDERIARMSAVGSSLGTYVFQQKYYKDKNYLNNNFLNSGDLNAIIEPLGLTGDIAYGWSQKSIDYSDASKVSLELHYPTGITGNSGNYFNVSCGLTGDYIEEDVTVETVMECSVTGMYGNEIISGQKDISFVFSWLKN